MPAYKYRAVNAHGRVARGEIAAANESELAQHLGLNGLELIEARTKKEAAPAETGKSSMRFSWRSRVAPRAIPVFCRQMADLLNAHVPFVEALRDVIEATPPGPLCDALTDTARAVNHGTRIADAFAATPRLFPPVFTAILAAGEASGDLPRTFTRLAKYTETRLQTQEQTRRALRYPLFLLVVALGTSGFMMTTVVPQIIQFLNSIDSALPMSTRILIAVSDIVAAGWWIIALAAVLGVVGIATLRRGSERAARLIDKLLLRIPVIGQTLRDVALARFMYSFATLYESNIGIVGGLKGARATLGNRALETMTEDAERQILSGRPLSAAMEGILPVFALRIIRIGERSGALDRSLQDIADMQDRDVAATTQKLIGGLEPALTLLIGALLAWIVLAVLGPIYGSLGKLTGVQ